MKRMGQATKAPTASSILVISSEGGNGSFASSLQEYLIETLSALLGNGELCKTMFGVL